MRTISFSTGRTYNGPQILELAFIAPTQRELDDDFSRFSTVVFVDKSRQICGTVDMLALILLECDANIGRDVLAAYDAGQYVQGSMK